MAYNFWLEIKALESFVGNSKSFPAFSAALLGAQSKV
jgi:hypothetical protein